MSPPLPLDGLPPAVQFDAEPDPVSPLGLPSRVGAHVFEVRTTHSSGRSARRRLATSL